ncbi:hypothetical protein NPX13_g8911 [Xylaria arbuscula]|uniref:Pentatricopeptide repeat domain-containing protein n=1 Tax=Xylaria arbuscula TaxID=114810 RepID=A0A9W8TJE0_9PEZI|nr:hypothetical protein NPX13_g8911 [Xylaria arbuscula]
MRLATRALRHVQPKRPVSHLPHAFTPLNFYGHANQICHAVVRASHGIRVFSSSPFLGFIADYDLIHPEISSLSPSSTDTHDALQTAPSATGSPLIQETRAFRKWGTLLADPNRLAIESDFFRQGPAKEWRSPLLVDKFENYGDLALWACLLDYQMRISGPAGVVQVWKALWGRKTLYDVDSPLAQMFWRLILDGALASDNPTFLEGVWIYSEWMYDLHGVKWPHLYTTVMRHLLRTHQHKKALQWQLRLMPNFYPGMDEFSRIIKEFVLDKELDRMNTLVSLYKISPEKNLYTDLLPYLFNLGQSELARKWRRVFILHGERPVVPTLVRPFLRFLSGYYPNDKLTSEELATLKLTPMAKNEAFQLSREFMNRVHGRTFRITVKNYNDSLGAKWFASSWIGLDAAISAVSAIGVNEIGPLSLQSIAIRAGNSEDLLNRISQLQEKGISVVESNYYRLIVYLAKKNDNELLYDLLRSDLHPEVFDDLNLQNRLIDSATDSSDWRTLRLLLVSKLVTFERSTRSVANSVLRLRFERRSQHGVLQILEHMKTRNIPLNFEEASHIYDSLIEDYNLSQRCFASQPAAFYLSIFRQLKSMDVPVPLTHWRLLMLSMARRGQVEDLARLGHKGTLEGVENLLGVYIPQDIPTKHESHPLRELLNGKLLTDLIENAFIAHPGQGFQPNLSAQPYRGHSQPSQITKAIQLLRVIHDRGMWIRYRKLSFAVTNCLVAIYGPGPPVDTRRRLMRASNTLRLNEMKTMIDKAWGGSLLPPIEDLIRIVRKRDPNATLNTSKRNEKNTDDEQDNV